MNNTLYTRPNNTKTKRMFNIKLTILLCPDKSCNEMTIHKMIMMEMTPPNSIDMLIWNISTFEVVEFLSDSSGNVLLMNKTLNNIPISKIMTILPPARDLLLSAKKPPSDDAI